MSGVYILNNFPEMFDGIERKNIWNNIPSKNVGEHFSYYSIVLSKNINKLFF